MKRTYYRWFLLPTLILLISVGYCRSQEAPEPPEPPDEPQAPLGVLRSQFMGMESGSRLGVISKDVTAEKARDLKLPGEYGALVLGVDTEGAAAKAGVQKGDVIVEFAGERVRSVAQLRRLIRETPPGRTVSLQVIRDGQARTLSAKLLAQPGTSEFHGEVPEIQIPEMHISPSPRTFDFRGFNFPFGGERPSLGISGDELTSQLASYFGVKQGKGILVREVVVGSPASKAGLKAGDVIVAVDGKSVATVAELRQALEIKPGEDKRKINLAIVRDHHQQSVPVEVEKQGLAEREKAAANFGISADEWQRVQTQAKAQMAAAQLALQNAQKQLSDKQRLLSDKMRRAIEEQQRALQQQLKQKLEYQKLLHSQAVQSDAI